MHGPISNGRRNASGNEGAALAAAAAGGLLIALAVLAAAVEALAPLLFAQPALLVAIAP